MTDPARAVLQRLVDAFRIPGQSLPIEEWIAMAEEVLAAPTPSLAELVNPQPGYQPGTDREDGAQLVQGANGSEWWAPEFGCDSLDTTLNAIAGRIAPYLREPVAGVDAPGPDGDYGGLVELCHAQGVDHGHGVPLLQRAQKVWGVGTATPAPSTDAVLKLAAILREVNSPHLLGAAAMAEAILSHPSAHAVLADAPSDEPAVTEEGREPAAVEGEFSPTVLATPTPPADGEAIGPEWRPCVKLPITVYVREQRPGETHVSTREGITPVKADDLIMRGVQGEEYPIGRELFSKTYRLGPAPASAENTTPPADGEAEELAQWLEREADYELVIYDSTRFRRAAALLRESRPRPVPVAERPWERPGWCDAKGRCWFGAPAAGAADAGWILRKPSERLSHQTTSLPHWAIPTPTESTITETDHD